MSLGNHVVKQKSCFAVIYLSLKLFLCQSIQSVQTLHQLDKTLITFQEKEKKFCKKIIVDFSHKTNYFAQGKDIQNQICIIDSKVKSMLLNRENLTIARVASARVCYHSLVIQQINVSHKVSTITHT